MKLTKVRVDSLRPHPKNYNMHPDSQVNELEKSLNKFGQYKNIVTCGGIILAGHGLVEAAKRRGDEFIYVMEKNGLTEDEQIELLIADNALPFGALPDKNELADLVSQLGDIGEIDLPGITEDWIKKMGIAGMLTDRAFNDEDLDNIPEESEIVPVCAKGDIWSLGDHVLACGDCLDVGFYKSVIEGNKIDFTEIDPPYEMDYRDQAHIGLMAEGCVAFWGLAFELFPVFKEMDIIPQLDIVWQFSFGRFVSTKRPYCNHRNIWFFNLGNSYNKDFRDENGRPASTFYSHHYESVNTFHRHQKPIKLYNYIFGGYTKEGCYILSPFGGSGSALISCEAMKRKSIMIEIDPRQCDLIIKRWENCFGKKSELIQREPAE